MKSTVVDESLSSTTNVLFQRRIYFLLNNKFCLLPGVLIHHELQQVLWNARILGWLVPRFFLFESITCLQWRPVMCVNVSTSCEGALPLICLLEICLQKGSVLCINQRVSLQSSMRGGGAFALSVVDVSVGDVASVEFYVLLWVWVALTSVVVVTSMWIEDV